MKLIASTVCASLALSACLIAAQDNAAPYPDNSAEMKKIGWLVGSWIGNAPYPPHGECTSQFKIDWAKTTDPKGGTTLNPNFLRAHFSMRAGGKVLWTDFSMIGWDKDHKRYTWFVFGMDGTIGTSIATKTKYGPKGQVQKLVLDGEVTGDSEWKKHQIVLLRVDENTMVQETLAWKDGKYVPMMGKITFKRQKPLKKALKKTTGAAGDKPTRS